MRKLWKLGLYGNFISFGYWLCDTNSGFNPFNCLIIGLSLFGILFSSLMLENNGKGRD